MDKPSTWDSDQPLPLHFTLLPTYSCRVDSPLVPVLFTRLPAPSSISDPARSGPIEVIRILDPEHREPFVSLARLLALIQPNPISPLATLKALKETELAGQHSLDKSGREGYSLILDGFAPFPDLWVSLALARRYALRYGLIDDRGGEERGPLANLLEWKTRTMWSVVCFASQFNKHQVLSNTSTGSKIVRRGELVSNWRVPEEILPLQDYSVEKMKNIFFDTVYMPPKTINDQHLIRLPISVPISPSSLLSDYSEEVRLTGEKTSLKSFSSVLADLCLLSSECVEGQEVVDSGDSKERQRILETLGDLDLRISRSLRAVTDLTLKIDGGDLETEEGERSTAPDMLKLSGLDKELVSKGEAGEAVWQVEAGRFHHRCEMLDAMGQLLISAWQRSITREYGSHISQTTGPGVEESSKPVKCLRSHSTSPPPMLGGMLMVSRVEDRLEKIESRLDQISKSIETKVANTSQRPTALRDWVVKGLGEVGQQHWMAWSFIVIGMVGVWAWVTAIGTRVDTSTL